MTVLVIDARSRDCECFIASATKLPMNHKAIVLRRASGDIGTVWRLCGQTIKHPILVIGSYQASSSYGYTSQLFSRGGHFREVVWVGGAGFGTLLTKSGEIIRCGNGLRPFGWPLKATLIPAGVTVEKIVTHRNLNHDTARAAYDGLQLMVKINKKLFVLAEGQSNYTSALVFKVPKEVEKIELPDEHRAHDIFSPEKILEAGIRRSVISEKKEEKVAATALKYALLNSALAVDRGVLEADRLVKSIPENIYTVLDIATMKTVVAKRYSGLIQEGWKFGVDFFSIPYLVYAKSPDGKNENILSRGCMPDDKVKEHFLHVSNDMGRERRSQLYKLEISSVLTEYFHSQWAWKLNAHGFLVEAWIKNQEKPVNYWFSHGNEGPNGEKPTDNRFLSAWDQSIHPPRHLFPKLIQVCRVVVTAYKNGEVLDSREWLASKSDSPYVRRVIKEVK